MTLAHGIDISSHQGSSLDFARIAQSGIDFVFLRYSVGTSKDGEFESNYTRAKAAGLLVGAYHFMWATFTAEQIALFTSLDPTRLDLPMVWDVEQTTITEPNLYLCLRETERITGRVPLIYTRRDIWHAVVGTVPLDRYKQYDLWVAQYPDPVGPYPTLLPNQWTNWRFWQYSDKGSVPGHVGPIDQNTYNGSVDDLCCRYAMPVPGEFVLEWPVDSPVVTQGFGNNPGYYGPAIGAIGLGHEGIDFRAPRGAAIYACAAGVVKAVYNDGAYGLQVRIDHQNGFSSVYAHLQQALVAVGQRVAAKERVGLADSTGNSSGDHLHLTVKFEGATARKLTAYPNDLINPTAYLKPPAQPVGVQMRNKSGLILNIRALPSASSADLGDIPVGAVVTAYPPAPNEYIKILYAGITGYALAKQFEIAT